MPRRMQLCGGLPAGLLFALVAGFAAPSAVARDEAAHAIAQRFAEEHVRAERKAAADAKRKADAAAAERRAIDEREMLKRAQAEAAEHARLEEERLAEDVRQRAIAEDRRRRAEAEVAERERQAAEARAKEVERQRIAAEEEQRRLEQEATARIRAEATAAEERRRRQAEARAKELEAERTAELDRISEQLRRIAREADARESTPPAATALTHEDRKAPPRDERASPVSREQTAATEPRNSALSSWPRHRGKHDGLVTILMVMEPGDRGIRRFEKTADPVICFERHCFVSTGAGTPARQLTRFQAFGTFNTLGARAGACRNSLACAYPGIDLTVEGRHVQPVDLRIMRHDRREVRELAADTSCDIVRGRLSCGAAVQAETWRIWVVPQAVADAAGPGLIEAALAGGLGRDTVALR